MCSGINIPINQSDFGAKYRIRARVGVQTTFLSTNNFCYSDWECLEWSYLQTAHQPGRLLFSDFRCILHFLHLACLILIGWIYATSGVGAHRIFLFCFVLFCFVSQPGNKCTRLIQCILLRVK